MGATFWAEAQEGHLSWMKKEQCCSFVAVPRKPVSCASLEARSAAVGNVVDKRVDGILRRSEDLSAHTSFTPILHVLVTASGPLSPKTIPALDGSL